jgi:hypothetical protein
MNADQEIRAAAAQAAATLMAPVQPPPQDYIAVANVIAVYIENGMDPALSLCGVTAEAPVETPAPAPVIESIHRPDPVPDVIEVAEAEQESEEKGAEVISISSIGQAPAKQQAARLIIEKTRKQRVDSIMGQASVAKAKAHKLRLIEEAESAELNEYTVVVKGQPTTLGAYLASL